MTERLYYRDSFLREFDAQVMKCAGQSGGRFLVELDRTAFYPTSGGQPHDTGQLGDVEVLEVSENEAGAVLHATARAVPVGAVHGTIHWPRRFDHMQQHSGQHVLSAAFLQLFQIPTVSFHLGPESSTIDLGAAAISPQQLEQAEQLANQVVFEDRAVEINFATAAELSAAGVRKTVDRPGVLRAISIADFDRQPCGGTHVSRTGQIGLILLRKVERQKQNWRLEFVCGGRALAAARNDYWLLAESARALTCGPPELPGVIRKTVEERQTALRAQQRLLEQLAEYEALELLAAADPAEAPGAPRVIARVFADADIGYLRMLATKLVAHPDVRMFLATRNGGHVLFAQSSGLDAEMNALLRDALNASGGKGGGTRDFAQGSVPGAASLDEVLARALAHPPHTS